MTRFIIQGIDQAPEAFGAGPESRTFVVETSSLDRACTVVRSVCPTFQIQQARLAKPGEGLGHLFRPNA